tara:strand:- start:3516 stop:3785 length:270 start_codon:yes stop_codon:yes gene_type:complete
MNFAFTFILLTICANAINVAKSRGMNRYRKSIFINVVNKVNNPTKGCPLIEYFDTRRTRADEIVTPLIPDNEDSIYELLSQEGEVSMLE